jgi:hypothetical protein
MYANALPLWLSPLAIFSLSLGLLCFLYILLDQRHRPAPMMAIMLWVWPINALWAGPFAIWAYRHIGNGSKPHITSAHAMKMDMPTGEHDMNMVHMHMKHMDMGAKKPFWQSITAGTLHCGAGCSLADLIGPWLFTLMPFLLWGSPVFGEWALDYLLALAIGVSFQYGGLIGMVPQQGVALWWRALKVDFLSLSAWQVGMYGWMGFATFWLIGPMHPTEAIFWLMMQIAMACGFITAYPMNWFLVKTGIKTAM